MVTPNRLRYLESLARELSVQSTRVRDLIGDAHWLSDGRHKEALLAELLRRHVPTGVHVSSGFIVSPFDDSRCSTEQDILLIDTLIEQPVFTQNGLAITFPRNVLATISVKTKLQNKETCDAIKGLHSAHDIIQNESQPVDVWFGAYFFGPSPEVDNKQGKLYEYVRESLKLGTDEEIDPRCIHLLATADRYACRFQHQNRQDNLASDTRVSAFDCGETSTSFFLAHLLDHIANRRGVPDSQFLDSLDVVETTAFDSHIDIRHPSEDS